MENQLDNPIYLWEGSVGAKIEQNRSGDFFTMTPIRRYKDKKSGKWKYANNFTSRNKKAYLEITNRAFDILNGSERKITQPTGDKEQKNVVGKITPVKVPAHKAKIG